MPLLWFVIWLGEKINSGFLYFTCSSWAEYRTAHPIPHPNGKWHPCFLIRTKFKIDEISSGSGMIICSGESGKEASCQTWRARASLEPIFANRGERASELIVIELAQFYCLSRLLLFARFRKGINIDLRRLFSDFFLYFFISLHCLTKRVGAKFPFLCFSSLPSWCRQLVVVVVFNW